MEKSKNKRFFVCHCLGDWEHRIGGQDKEDVETQARARHTRQPTRDTAERDGEM